MTTIDEKEILEIEKLKADLNKVIQDTRLDMDRFGVEQQRLNLEISKKGYEAWRLAFYGVAVGFGGTFALAKTITLLN